MLAEQLIRDKCFTYAACERLVQVLPVQHIGELRQVHTTSAAPALEPVPAGALVLGLFAHGPMCGVTRGTEQCVAATKYFNLFLKDKLPPGELHQWSSLSISRNVPSKPHMDVHNVATSDNLSVSMGQFQGGELWLEVPVNEVRYRKVEWRVKGNGVQVPGRLLNTKHRLVVFNPKTTHATQPWQGFRVSITAYLCRAVFNVPQSLIQQLTALHFPLNAPQLKMLKGKPAEVLAAVGHEPTRDQGVPEPAKSSAKSFPGNAPRSSVAIVLEDHPAVSPLLQQRGLQVEHLQPSHVNSTATATLSRRLKEGAVSFVWFDLPIPGRQVAKAKLSAHVTQLCVWLQLCAEQGIPGAVFGAFGSQWQHACLQDLIQTRVLVKSYHRLCHFGLKIDPAQVAPSRTCFVMASNVHAQGHACRCPESQNGHVLDWVAPKLPHQRGVRAQMHARMAQHAVQQLIGAAQLAPQAPQRSTPDDNLYQSCVQIGQSVPATASDSSASSLGSLPPRSGTNEAGHDNVAAANFADTASNVELSAPAGCPSQSFSNSPDASHAPETHVQPEPCYPTEARLRQKERKAQGHVAQPRAKWVEDHHDDCGTFLESLASWLQTNTCDPQHTALWAACVDLPVQWFRSSASAVVVPRLPGDCFLASSIAAARVAHQQWGPGRGDILSLQGGSDLTAAMWAHRVSQGSQCPSLWTLLDLRDPACATDILGYIERFKPQVVVLAPNAPQHLDPSTVTFGRICGHIAQHQVQSSRHFLCEQPASSFLSQLTPWPSVLADRALQWLSIPGGPGKPDIELWSSSAWLLQPCVQQPLPPQRGNLWSQELAHLVQDGCTLLLASRHLQQGPCVAFPSVASGPSASGRENSEDVPRSEAEPWRNCPGCRGRQARHDPRHTRVAGQCRYPNDESLHWDCEGCKYHRPRTHPSHSNGPDCRCGIIEARAGGPRRGRHPRPPAPKASASTTQDLQAQLPGGGDLGAAEEEAAAAATPNPSTPDIEPEELARMAELPVPDLQEPASAAGAVRERPPGERAAREERRPKDAAAGTESPSDWARFDVSRSLRVLRTGADNACKLELRKLHLRLWHAGRQSMTQVLRAVGVKQRILDMIPEIIQTCAECRKWQCPAPATQHALSASLAFNQHVEFDLLFYRQHIVCHAICRATRWHAATAVASKDGEVLQEALSTMWITIHGPMANLISDGEGGLWRSDVANRLKRQGIKMQLRAPQQHARYIERRGAVLRATLHVMHEQLERESVQSSFPIVLAEAVFAGNSLTHVGGSTPYQAVYGRQPAMLPPLEAPDLPNSEEISEQGDYQRERVRRAALEAMMQATSMARLSRATRTRTQPDSTRTFQAGELVDIYRPQSRKDASGWFGPYRISQSLPGQVVVQIQGVDRTYRAQDVRHALLVLFAEHQPSGWSDCLELVLMELHRLKPGHTALFGFASSSSGNWELTPVSKARPQVLHALEHLLQSCWRLGDACAVRLARGVRHLSNVPQAAHSTLLWWHVHPDKDIQFCTLDSTKVDLLGVIGPSYPSALVVQAIQTADQDVSLAEACDGTAEVNHETSDGHCLPDSDGERVSVHTPHGPLSAIAEEPEAEEAAETYLAQVVAEQAEVVPALREIFHISAFETLEPVSATDLMSPPICYVEPTPVLSEPVDHYCHYRQSGLDPSSYGSLQEQDEQGNGYVEVWFTRDFAKVIGDTDRLEADETYALRVYAAGFRNAVIQRESDLLTSSEIRQNQAAVDAATLEELRIWMKYGCFERAPRASSRNVMDSKFVTKWKKTKDSCGTEVRIIRQRLALRGFKDLQAAELEAHAATGSRLSQRLLCSEAACRPHWRFVALDISKAFLQGLTYKEIASRTGEEERDVCFTLPPSAVPFLRQLEGFENFDERQEVLRCVKPGTGCKDAPRAFSMKLAEYTRSEKI